MRRENPLTQPLILGAGPAGSMAAILLAKGGTRPILIDRDAKVGNALCGGFMSWRTAGRLRAVDCDLADLGAHPVQRLALYAGNQRAEVKLPATGYGLSRRALDTTMRAKAVAAGAQLEIDRITGVEPGCATGERQDWLGDGIFLASGKYDIRGLSRPRNADDSAMGIRLRVPPKASLTAMIDDAIELHFFKGGYAGIVLQEDGAANVCLAVRKSLLIDAGGKPRDLLHRLAKRHPAFGHRMALADADCAIDSIGAVPYGWIAKDTAPGLYRLGDQAAVIPSLAGEGMAIALASADSAARHWLADRSAAEYQRSFARQAFRPVKSAKAIWAIAEKDQGGTLLTQLTRFAPFFATVGMKMSRID